LTQLREQERDLPTYRKELAVRRAALPSVPGTPDFVRQLQAAGDKVNVDVTGVTVGDPEPTAQTGTFALAITLNATGTMAHIEGFLDQLHEVQARAVLIDNVDVTAAGEKNPSLDDEVNATFSLTAFVAPQTGTAGSPTK
jgi:hypothetical protein